MISEPVARAARRGKLGVLPNRVVIMAEHTFLLTREHVALCDLLKLLAIAQSGGHAKSMIADGMVTVDGKLETRKTRKLTGGELVVAAGETVRVQAA